MKRFVLLTVFMVSLICSSYGNVSADPITFRSTFTTEIVDVNVVLPLNQIRELRGKLARSLSAENFIDGFLTAVNLFVWFN